MVNAMSFLSAVGYKEILGNVPNVWSFQGMEGFNLNGISSKSKYVSVIHCETFKNMSLTFGSD
jgi:hypothetical protein